MRIQNNVMALNTHRQLGINNLNQSKSTEKLSSGFRINRAADDASGLMISEKMRAQIRGLSQASSNAQDGISLIQAAEGALQETHSILQRLRELSVKAANDVNEKEDRGAIQSEMNQLVSEIDRIAFTTEFNKKTLLDGSLQNGATTARVLSGFGVTPGIVASSAATVGTHTIEVTGGKKGSDSIEFSDTSKLKAGDIVTFEAKIAKGTAQNIFTYEATGNTDVDAKAITNGIKAAIEKLVGDKYTVSSSGAKVTIENKTVGVTAAKDLFELTKATTVKADGTAGTFVAADVVATNVDGTAAAVKVDGTATVAGDLKNGIYTKANLSFRIDDLTRTSAAVVNVATGRSLTFQVGANTGSDQTIGLGVRALSAAGLGVDFLSVSTHSASQSAIDSIEKAIGIVSEQRSALGAVQNRLEHTVANLDTVGENLVAAESRIRDVDMAKEMMSFTKNNILSQAATAMLAQANQAPQTVLQLLR